MSIGPVAINNLPLTLWTYLYINSFAPESGKGIMYHLH